jgi:hypothetical protein
LRRDLKVNAYVFRQTYDFSQPVQGKGYDKYGKIKMMKQHRGSTYDAYAVLVGDYASIDDPQAQKALEKIRFADPDCLDPERGSTQRFAGLRHWQRRLNPEKRQRGPMGNAFVTRNPLLGDDALSSKALDPVVADMNREAEFSLLRCKGRYTVRVATFRGEDTMKIAEISSIMDRRVSGQLEDAAIKAHRLAKALREQGVEAYEFHDRYESVVTVGSFDSMGTPLPDGQVEINPLIYEVMKNYSPQKQALPGMPEVGLAPKRLAGVPFDVQPMPIEVPRESIGARYARANDWLR